MDSFQSSSTNGAGYHESGQAHSTITANHFRCRNIIVPAAVFGNGLPLRHSALKSHAGQPGAVFEGRTANAGYTVRDGDAGQPGASLEGPIGNAGHAGRNFNLFHVFYIIKSMMTDLRTDTVLLKFQLYDVRRIQSATPG